MLEEGADGRHVECVESDTRVELDPAQLTTELCAALCVEGPAKSVERCEHLRNTESFQEFRCEYVADCYDTAG